MPMKNCSTFNLFLKNLYFNQYCDFDSFFEMYEDENIELEKTENSPSEKIVQKILDFAHTYGVMETKSAGQVEMNLN